MAIRDGMDLFDERVRSLKLCPQITEFVEFFLS